MKNKWLLILFFLPSLLNASPVDMTLGWGTNWQNGLFHEIVYDNVGGERYILSRLFWDMDNLFTAGPHLDIRFRKWNLTADYRFPLNKGSGQMEDFDWLGYYTPQWGVGVEEDEWTHYSLSDVSITQYHDIKIDLSYQFSSYEIWGIEAGLGYRWQKIRWEDVPLYKIYSDINFRDDFSPFTTDNAINYNWFNSGIYLKMNTWFQALDWLRFNLAFENAPHNLRYSQDYHVMKIKDRLYLDIFKGSSNVILSLAADIQIKRYKMSLTYRVNSYSLTDNESLTEIYEISSGDYLGTIKNLAGSRAKYNSLTLGFAYCF